MAKSLRRVTSSIAVIVALAAALSACGGGSGSAPTHSSSTTGTTFGAKYRAAAVRLLRPVIIKGYVHGGATAAQAKEVANCVIPILAQHGITSLLDLNNSSATKLVGTSTSGCKKKLGIK